MKIACSTCVWLCLCMSCRQSPSELSELHLPSMSNRAPLTSSCGPGSGAVTSEETSYLFHSTCCRHRADHLPTWAELPLLGISGDCSGNQERGSSIEFNMQSKPCILIISLTKSSFTQNPCKSWEPNSRCGVMNKQRKRKNGSLVRHKNYFCICCKKTCHSVTRHTIQNKDTKLTPSVSIHLGNRMILNNYSVQLRGAGRRPPKQLNILKAEIRF